MAATARRLLDLGHEPRDLRVLLGRDAGERGHVAAVPVLGTPAFMRGGMSSERRLNRERNPELATQS